MRYLVTGVAGFIGSQLAEKLVANGHEVVGIDCFTDYYARDLKERNLTVLRRGARFRLVEGDLAEMPLNALFESTAQSGGFDGVFHQAAQPGVRGSWGPLFEHYARNNVLATQRLLEAATEARVAKFVYASSSSVYGDVTEVPSRETHLPRPFSPYGVTKLAAEHLCELYRMNYGLPTVSLRYFTVFGPRQRPDMAFARFIAALFAGKPIPIFGDGKQTRDFTFVADAVDANILALAPGVTGVFNIGGGTHAGLGTVLDTLRDVTGRTPVIEAMPGLPGDVRQTSADTSRAKDILGFAPKFDLRTGLAKQVEWYESLQKDAT